MKIRLGMKVRTIQLCLAFAFLVLTVAGCRVVKVVPPDETSRTLNEPANMGFEKPGPNGGADTWRRPDYAKAYERQLDERIKRSGKYSARIEYISGDTALGGSWDQWYFVGGRKAIHIKGWIKTEGADTCPECSKPGHNNDSLPEGKRRGAEIRLNLYPGNYTMLTPIVTGTSNWTLFEARADVPVGTTQLILAPILWGKGTAWFDDLTLTLRGTP